MSCTRLAAIDTWHRLREPGARLLLERLAACKQIEPATIERLRRDYPADLVAAAVELTVARRKGNAKFPGHQGLIADVIGVEQATSACVAAYKARRFAEARADGVVDLCCGIGGDALGLSQVAEVVAVDHHPLRAWMARHNARCRAVIADVSKLNLQGRFFHLDPARRCAGAGRTFRRLGRYADYQPGSAYIDALLRRCPDGAVKLGPGVDFDDLPPGEVELIGEHGRLVQAVLWTGRFVRAQRSAAQLPEGISISGSLRPVPIGQAQRYLLAVDPAVERAGLMGQLAEQLGTPAIHPKLGLLTANEPVNDPWVVPFELLERMPWHRRNVKAWLRANDAGVVEVKTRGGAVDANTLQRQLRGEGGTTYALFVLRLDRRIVAYLTRRVPRQ